MQDEKSFRLLLPLLAASRVKALLVGVQLGRGYKFFYASTTDMF